MIKDDRYWRDMKEYAENYKRRSKDHPIDYFLSPLKDGSERSGDIIELINFAYKSTLSSRDIVDSLKKYGSFEAWEKKLNIFNRFINLTSKDKPSQKVKSSNFKYTTYSSHGHYGTNNPVFAILNYIAMLPTALLMGIMYVVSSILVNLGELFGIYKKDKK
jgi:hypothetical protein